MPARRPNHSTKHHRRRAITKLASTAVQYLAASKLLLLSLTVGRPSCCFEYELIPILCRILGQPFFTLRACFFDRRKRCGLLWPQHRPSTLRARPSFLPHIRTSVAIWFFFSAVLPAALYSGNMSLVSFPVRFLFPAVAAAPDASVPCPPPRQARDGWKSPTCLFPLLYYRHCTTLHVAIRFIWLSRSGLSGVTSSVPLLPYVRFEFSLIGGQAAPKTLITASSSSDDGLRYSPLAGSDSSR